MSVTVSPTTRAAKTYALDLQRGSNAISGIELSFSGGKLTHSLLPLFDPTIKNYSTDVGLWLQQVQLTVIPMVPGSSITVAGEATPAGAPSSPLSLNFGLTSIPIKVTSSDGTVSSTYNLEINRAAAVAQQAYGKASNTGRDEFGYSVAVWEDTLVVGADREASAATGVGGNQADNSAEDSGAVYVFMRSGGSWTQQAYLKASNTDAQDSFGYSVAVWGDTLVVGAPSEMSATTGVGGGQSDNSAPGSGAVYVFTRTSGTWTQQAYISKHPTLTQATCLVAV